MSLFQMPSYVQSSYLGLVAIQLEVSLGAVLAGLVVALPLGQLCSRLPGSTRRCSASSRSSTRSRRSPCSCC